MPEVKAPPVYRIVLYRRFDVNDAEFHERYFLEQSKMVGIFRKRREWVPVTVERTSFMGDTHKIRANGNEEWAKRIMKEFHIEGVVLL